MAVTKIGETEFERLCAGIHVDRESIIRHNPVGTPEETLLWMLLSVLVSYLSIAESDAPCFKGHPEAKTYRDAILYILRDRKKDEFDPSKYLDSMTAASETYVH